MSATPQKSVYETILEWAKTRPLWQRDALRRIVVGGKLNDADIDELLLICLGRPRLDGSFVQPTPLAMEHLPSAQGNDSSITIASISAVTGANRLASGQTLPFVEDGLTIVYGDNGVGKSGYTRILKKACRARVRTEILPDAFDITANKGAKATLTYSIGGLRAAPLDWVDDDVPHHMLSAISVLDRDCAAIHVRGANEVAFRPLGLDVPDELAAACQSIKDALTSEQERCQQSQDTVFIKPTYGLATAVGQVMTSLTAKTDVSTMHRIASLSVDEEARLQRLGEDLLRDSAKVASEHRGLAHSLQRFSQQLETLLQSFSDVEMSATNSLRADAATKRGAAKMATQMAMSESTIAGVGESSWKVLWEAARHFADQHSHPGYNFPDGPPDQACVLCHQELSGEAKTRMNAFEAFVKDKTEVDADNADAALKRALKAVKDSTVRLASFPMHHQLKSIDPLLAKVVRRSLAVARARRNALLSTNEQDVLTAPGFPAGAVEGIQRLIAKALAYASELDGAADQAGRKKLEDELAELRDRKALSDLIPKAEVEIKRLAMLERIETCLGETATRAVTTLGNAIADDVITPKVRDRFQLEIQKLASTRVRVDIVRSGGRFGSPQYAVQLFANQKAKVAAVLSEGEQTCVAIAAFMTELATAPHSSALVFDDPVSSLDHRWRQKVAERLVEEASVRQVIVFTHDLVFLNDLETAAVSANTPHGVVSLSQGVAGAGIVEEGLPWVGAKIPERIDTLEKEARAAAKLFNAMDDQGYAAAAAQFYSKLRSSWERALEDVAFCGVLNRHRDYINAKNLRNVVALTEDDVAAWAAGFKICCDQTNAHDPSRGRNASPPPPEDLLKHVGDLSAWVSVLKGRQKALTKDTIAGTDQLAPA